MRAVGLVVVGSLNMDLSVRVPTLPRPGETVAGETLLRAAGGKGANQAVAAARLGASVEMVGRVGRDSFGRELTRGLREQGVSTRWVRTSERSTGAALIEVDAHGENTIAVAAGANADLLPDHVPPGAIGACEVVSAVLEIRLATVEQAFRLARAHGVRTVLNTAPAQALPASLLRLADVLICNEPELAVLTGRATDPEPSARELRATPEQIVVVTLGAAGAFAVVGDDTVRQPAFQVDVVDTTGAGDAFVAGFVCARWWSAGVPAALALACAAGGLATTVAGAQPSMPTRAAVDALLGGALP